jgi:hypothetical protein
MGLGAGQPHVPAALYHRKRPGTHFTVGWVGPRVSLDGRKISTPTGFQSRTVQHVVSHYTDWASRPTIIESYMAKSQSVKWLVLGWIVEFESFKGRIFSVCRIIRKVSELHPSSRQWHRFISDVKANIVSSRSLPTSGFDVSNFRNSF